MINLDPLSMESAQKFWRDKIQLSPSKYNKLSDEAKLKAFAVSGIAKGDELSTVFDAMQKAIDNGTTFDNFKKDAASVFEKRGWAGKGAWRLDNIFRTNIQTAYNVGRYDEMMSVIDSRPFWQYHAVNDARTRPTHAALNGKVFPANHPFWDKWYPPNGFRCRCTVTTLSERDVNKEKLKIEKNDPSGELIEPVDPLTGGKMPARLLLPDNGFAFNPGKVQWGFLEEGMQDGKFIDFANLKKASDYGLRSLENVSPKSIPDFSGEMLPQGMGDDFYKAEFLKRYGENIVLKDAVSEPAILSLRAFLADKTEGAKEIYKFDKPGHGESIPLLKEMIENPFEIWLTPQKNDATGKVRLAKRYVSLWKTEEKDRIGGFMVFETIRGMFQGVTSFLPVKGKTPDINYLNRQRRGVLLLNKGQSL